MKEVPNKTLGRRSFLKGALAATAMAAVPTVLAGCSQPAASSAEPAADALPATSSMTQEERAAAIADSTFMGGDTDFYGKKLDLIEGPAGQIVQREVPEFFNWLLGEVGTLEKVTDRVYVSHTYPLTNSVLFIGDTGIIVCDTSGNKEDAEKDLAAWRTVTDLPVKGIIYSHDHYALGTTAYIPEGNPDNIPIIAHENLMNQMAFTMGAISPCYQKRALYQYSIGLPAEGPDAPLAAAVDTSKKETFGFMAPNDLIAGDVEMEERVIDGLTFRLYPGTSDSPCTLSIYCVEEDVMYSNMVMPTFFNMYTLRGEAYRDPAPMIKEIDVARAANPNIFIPCMGRALIGREDVKRELELYRDSIQFVYDQTIRFMNQGYGPDELVNLVKIPEFIVDGTYTGPFYGELEHYVRGVYRGLNGWFGNDVVELHPVNKTFEHAKIVQAMGGDDAVAAEAQRVLDDKQYSWAATLCTYVLTNNPEHEVARNVKADALMQMAYVSKSTITRSWYSVQAYELRGEVDVKGVAGWLGGVSLDKLPAAERSILLDHLRVSIDPDKAMGMNETLTITLTDEGESHTMALRNCVGAIEKGKPENPSVELKMTFNTMGRITVGETPLKDAIASGDVELVGDESKLDAILDVCELKI